MSEVVVHATVKEFRRLGKFKNDRARPRTLLVSFQSEHEVRMMLARVRENRESISQRDVFPLSVLEKDDALRDI